MKLAKFFDNKITNYMKPLRNISQIFLNYSDENYSDLFLYNMDSHNYHTDIIDELKFKIHKKCVALISTTQNEINYIAIVKKCSKVASKKSRILIENILEFKPAISYKDISDNITPLLMKTELNHVSLINHKAWNVIVPKIIEVENNRTQLGKIFNYFYNDKNNEVTVAEEINGFEKDSLTLILKCSGFDQYNFNLSEFDISKDNMPTFLKSLNTITVREDILIMHDSTVFDDWDIVDKNIICTTLSDGQKKLSILYSNRLQLEETLGVDLIYVDEINKSVVMIQYKRMLGKQSPKYYPFSDSNYQKEINSMLRIKAIIDEFPHYEYRFNDDVFYFKLCKAVQPTRQRNLIDGMYIPISYWNHLLRGESLVGKKGGKSFSYDTVPKYFNNTTFLSLMKTGLIGCRQESFAYLVKIFKELYEHGNSIVLAKLRHV